VSVVEWQLLLFWLRLLLRWSSASESRFIVGFGFLLGWLELVGHLGLRTKEILYFGGPHFEVGSLVHLIDAGHALASDWIGVGNSLRRRHEVVGIYITRASSLKLLWPHRTTSLL